MNFCLLVLLSLTSLGFAQAFDQNSYSPPQYDPSQQGDGSNGVTVSTLAPIDNPNDYSTAFPAAPAAPQTPPAPAAPAAPAEVTPPAVIEDGISTMDQEGGNWLLKRKALEKTVDTIEVINVLFTKILDMRMDFIQKRNKADKEYDDFVLKNGFNVGQLQAVLESLTESLNQEREKQGDLTIEEREALQAIGRQIALVEQQQKDLEALAKLDEAIDQVLMQFEDEVKKSHTYQMGAWANFQEIKKVLNDQKAEELYLKTEGLYTNLQEVDRYLSGDLKNYLNQTIKKLHDTMVAIQGAIDSLKKEEVDLSLEVRRLEKADEAEAPREHAEKKPAPAPVAKPWYSAISAIWEYPAQKVSDLIGWVASFF